MTISEQIKVLCVRSNISVAELAGGWGLHHKISIQK